MKKLIIILIASLFIACLFLTCKPQGEIYVSKSMIPLEDIEFKMTIYSSEFARIWRRYGREGMTFRYKQTGRDKFIIYLTETHIEKSVKDKGKRSVLPKKYDQRLRNAIYEEIY